MLVVEPGTVLDSHDMVMQLLTKDPANSENTVVALEAVFTLPEIPEKTYDSASILVTAGNGYVDADSVSISGALAKLQNTFASSGADAGNVTISLNSNTGYEDAVIEVPNNIGISELSVVTKDNVRFFLNKGESAFFTHGVPTAIDQDHVALFSVWDQDISAYSSNDLMWYLFDYSADRVKHSRVLNTLTSAQINDLVEYTLPRVVAYYWASLMNDAGKATKILKAAPAPTRVQEGPSGKLPQYVQGLRLSASGANIP
jgi:hypothetical protein